MTDIKLKILTEKDFLFLAKRKPEGVYDRETLKNLYRIIKRLNRGKQFCTGDEKRLLKKYQNITFGLLLPKNTDTKGKITEVSEALCKLTGYTKKELITLYEGFLKKQRKNDLF